MSYAIRYGPENKGSELEKKKKGKYIFAATILGAALAGVLLWPDGAEALRLALCPWLDQGTVAALGNMIVQVREGTSVVQAVTAFCEEVIRNAGILV